VGSIAIISQSLYFGRYTAYFGRYTAYFGKFNTERSADHLEQLRSAGSQLFASKMSAAAVRRGMDAHGGRSKHTEITFGEHNMMLRVELRSEAARRVGHPITVDWQIDVIS
jgi:hypothetical protein